MLRLPVAHCELNPIELAWASVKRCVAKHNKTFTFKEIQQLTPEGILHTTTDMWRSFCRQVVNVENKYFDKDRILEDAIDEMTFEVGGSDDEDSENEDTDSLMDDSDRRLIDQALQEEIETSRLSTSSTSTSAETSTSASTR